MTPTPDPDPDPNHDSDHEQVVLTLKLFTPFFTHVPKAVLASCLIVAVSGLVDVERLQARLT